MDNQKRAGQLRNQLGTLNTQKQETEGKLVKEHEKIRQVAAKRSGLITSLNEADDVAARRAHRELDACDSEIRVGERMAEALQKSLEKIAQEAQTLRRELAEIEAAIRQEETDKAFAAWQSRITQGFASASELLANARVCLAEINKLALLGEHEFSARASALLAQKFDEFVIQEANPNLHGFQDARPLFQDTTVHVRPMTRARA